MKKIVCYLLISIILLTGCGKKDLKAAEYVRADLELIFQGETQEAKEFLDASSSDLKKVYENGIQSFVENYLIIDTDEESGNISAYSYYVEEIFRTMKYQVGEAVEKDKDTYEVTVTYQPADVFVQFAEKLQEESAKIQQKQEEGQYTGTEEEQKQAMLEEYVTASYELLGESYSQMQYNEAEEFTFTVTRSEKNQPQMSEDEINQFIVQILLLDKL